jgi:hypothetical protein
VLAKFFAPTVCSQCSVAWPGILGLAGVPWKHNTIYLENGILDGSAIMTWLPTSLAWA